MKMRTLGCILFTLGIFLATSSVASWAAGSPKIGYFEIQTILQQSKWGKQSNEEFKRQGEATKAEVERKSTAFKTAKDEFDKKKDVLDEKTRAKKLKELQDLQQEGEKLLMESNSKLQKLSNDLSSPLVDKIMEIVRKIGRDDKYDYILEREKGGLVFANEKEDLTKRIVEELDRSPRK